MFQIESSARFYRMVMLCFAFGMILSANGFAQKAENTPSRDAAPNGAFTYALGIEVPPGTNGMAPNLGLSYNSAAGNGILGMGWSLEGVPVISRDAVYPLNYDDTTDHFLYDGQKLIWNASLSAYEPERDKSLRFRLYYPNTTNSYWLAFGKDGRTVFFGHNPLVAGSESTNGWIPAIGKTGKAQVWALTAESDPMRNFYYITYDKDPSNGDYYPMKIRYTLNDKPGAALNVWRTVEFGYEGRNDHAPIYNPTLIDMDKRLTTVTVKTGVNEQQGQENPGYQVRKYILSYANTSSTQRSLLQKVVEEGSDGTKRRLADFEWQDGGNSFGAPIMVVPTGQSLGYEGFRHFEDFNGDGKKDFITLAYSGGYKVLVYKSNGTTMDPVMEMGISDPGWGYSQKGDLNYRHWIDIDGDGRSDLVTAVGGTVDNPNNWRLYKSDGTDLDEFYDIPTSIPVKKPFPTQLPISSQGYWVDVNNDGKTDYVYHQAPDNGNLVFKIHLSNGTTLNPTAVEKTIYYGSTNTFLSCNWVDINGDGRVDWLIESNPGSYAYANPPVYTVYLSQYTEDPNVIGYGSGVALGSLMIAGYMTMDGTVSQYYVRYDMEWKMSATYSLTGGPNYFITTAVQPQWLDFNADGRTDFVFLEDIDSGSGINLKAHIYLSTGEGMTSLADSTIGTVPIGSTYRWMDFNADTHPDLIVSSDTGLGEDHKIYLSTGSTFLPPFTLTISDNGWEDLREWADYNGDGRMDYLCRWGIYPNQQLQAYPVNSTQPDLLKTVKTPQGGQWSATYTPAPQVSGAILANPNTDSIAANQSPRPLVTQLNVQDGQGNTITTTYGYYNGLIGTGLPQNRKDLGFQTITKTTNGISTTTTLDQTIPRPGVPLFVETRDSGSNLVSSTTTEYTNTSFPYLPTKIINRSYGPEALPYATRVDLIYDGVGNVIEQNSYGEVNTSGADIVVDDNSTQVTEYLDWTAPAGNERWYNLVKRTQSWSYDKTLVGGLAGERRYYYDGNLTLGVVSEGLVTLIEDDLSEITGDDPVTTMGYDAWGNVIWSKDPNTNAGLNTPYQGCTSQITYDTVYRTLPVSTINAKGHTSTITYDRLMRPLTTVDPDGRVSATTYDSFARVSTITPPGFSYPSVKYLYYTTGYKNTVTGEYTGNSEETGTATSDNPSAQLTLTLTSGTGASDSDYSSQVTFTDGLGRTIQTRGAHTQYFDTQDSIYDATGRLVKTTIPYTQSTNAFTTTERNSAPATVYSYDQAGRLKITTYPDSTRAYHLYGATWQALVNAKGQVSASETWRNTTSSLTYDNLDYQSHISNASAETGYNDAKAAFYPVGKGQWTYQVETKTWRGRTEKSEKNSDLSQVHVITGVFDRLGRKTSLMDPDLGTWSYTYDKNGNPATQTDAKSQTLTYVYDELNRLTQKKNGGTVLATYSFDTGAGYATGKLTGVTTANETTSYIYNIYDRLQSESRAITNYGTRTTGYSYNTIAQLTQTHLPTGETLTHTYDHEGRTKTQVGINTIINDMIFNPRGQLTGATYAGGAYTSAYTYNNLSGLLTNIKTTNYLQSTLMDLSYTYDAVGNINTRTDNTNSLRNEVYSYDKRNRLTTAQSDPNWMYGTQTYAYDIWNNITSKEGKTLSYTDPNHMHAVTGDGTSGYTYDSNGNRVTKTTGATTDSYTWDEQNRLIEVKRNGTTIQTNTYDDRRQRLTKTENAATVVYWSPQHEETYPEGQYTNPTKTTTYYYAGTSRVAQRENGTLSYQLTDHLNSTSITTNITADTILSKSWYKPYGEIARTEGTSPTRYGYTGTEHDTSTDLQSNGARYLDNSLGRWTSVDPARYDIQVGVRLSLPEKMNPYMYAMNNPIGMSDVSGLRGLSAGELNLAVTILGTTITNSFYDRGTSYAYTDQIDYSRIDIHDEPNGGRAFSLPGLARDSGSIGFTESFSSNAGKSVLVHEVFHQLQYQKSGGLAIFKLVGEQIKNTLMGDKSDVYTYDLNKIGSLSDIETLEGQAQFVQDFTKNYLEYQDATDKTRKESYAEELKKMAPILDNSGVKSQAVKEFLPAKSDEEGGEKLQPVG